MRSDLLAIVRDHKDVTDAIVLTHDVDFVFVQNLLLDALRRCGSPCLTVFADSGRAAASYASQEPLLSGLGRRYRVVPVPMPAHFRFHPKALLLAGRERATLIVGSGNLTFGGWRENAEIWVRYDSSEGTGEFAAFREYASGLVERLTLNDPLRDALEQAFDPGTHIWARELEPPRGLLGRLGVGRSLLESMKEAAGPGPKGRLTICSPYFDAEGEVLRLAPTELGAAETLVLTDAKGTNLQPAAAQDLPPHTVIRSVAAAPTEQAGSQRLVHAKFFAVERESDVLVFLGSANCSRAALTTPGSRGNMELMAVRELSREEFGEVMQEVEESALPDLAAAAEEQDEPDMQSTIPRLLAARSSSEGLMIGFDAPAGWDPVTAVVDGEEQGLRDKSPGRCLCLAPRQARSVRLRGLLGGELVESTPLWIDHESDLAQHATSRSLAAVLRRQARRDRWDVDGWAEFLESFCRDLEYSSARTWRSRRKKADEPTDGDRIEFSHAELFASAARLSLTGGRVLSQSDATRASVQAYIQHYFSQDDEPYVNGSSNRDEGRGGPEGTEPVDEPVEVRPTESTELAAAAERRARQAGLRAVEQMTKMMSSEKYLSARHPVDLARDVGIASFALRKGHAKSWIERDQLLNATSTIWSALFAPSGTDDGESLLERREREDRVWMRHAFGTPLSTAGLFAWGIEVPEAPSTPREVQLLFLLTRAVTFHPWAWIASDTSAMQEEVVRLLRATSDQFNAATIEQRWQQLISLGRGFERLHAEMTALGLKAVRESNHVPTVESGDLLWQGTLGFLVALDSASRTDEKKKIHTLSLRAGSSGKTISAKHSNPVSGLVGGVGSLGPFEGGDLACLKSFLGAVRNGSQQPLPA